MPKTDQVEYDTDIVQVEFPITIVYISKFRNGINGDVVRGT